MTVGNRGPYPPGFPYPSPPLPIGYHENNRYGSLVDALFMHEGKTYEVDALILNFGNRFEIETTPAFPMEELNGVIKMTIKTTAFAGGWSDGGQTTRKVPRGSLSFEVGDTVAVKIETSAPTAVTNLRAEPPTPDPNNPYREPLSRSEKLALSWDKGLAETFELRHGPLQYGYGDWENIGAETTHTLTGLTNWTKHYVEVRGVNDVGKGPSDWAVGTPEPDGLHAPGFLSAKGLNEKLQVGWDAVDTADKHEICHSTADDDCAGGIWAETNSDTAHFIKPLTNGTPVYVWVRGVDSAGAKGEASETSGTPMAATEPPDRPFMFHGPEVGLGQATVDWDAPQHGAEVESYELAIGLQDWDDGPDWSFCPSTSAPTCPASPIEVEDVTTDGYVATKQKVTGLTNGEVYAFRVRAKNVAGTSEWTYTRHARPRDPAKVGFSQGVPGSAGTVGKSIEAVVLPEATGGTGAVSHGLAPAAWNGLSVDASTRTFSGTPDAAGSQTFTWTATDETGASDSLTFTATVSDPADTVAPTLALGLAEGVETPAAGAFGIVVTFSEAVTGFGLDDLSVAHGAASALSGSGTSYTATMTPEEGYAGDLTVDVAAGAAQDAAGNASTAAETLTVAVTAPPPITKPINLETNTTADTAWKSLDLSFDAPPASSDWVAANSQVRVLGIKEGAKRTPWRPLEDVSVKDGKVHASTKPFLAIGRVFEVEVRYCGETISDAACSDPSDMVYGASPASAPTDAQATASGTAATLSWSISPIGGKKNLQAAYEIGYAADSSASAPETLLTSVPSFGSTEAEISDLEAGTAYRLFVRSIVEWQGTRHFASTWASAGAETASAGADSLAQQALRKALTGQARRLLEEASDVIGRRLSSTGDASAPLTAFAGLFGAPGPSECSMEDSLGACATRAFEERHAGFEQDRFGLAGARLGFGRDEEVNQAWAGDFGDIRERIRNQGFAMALTGSGADGAASGDGVALTLWGGGSPASVDGSGALFWGMDAGMGDRWTAGLAFSGSDASSSWQSSRGSTHASGLVQSDVSAVYPYARGQFGDDLELWSLGGWGTGRFSSRWSDASSPGAEEAHLEGDLGFSMGLVGAERALYEAGGLSVAALGDAGWSRLAASGETEMEVLVHRTRVGFEGRYAPETGSLTSFFRASARLDGGEEEAQGVELAGNLMTHVSGLWETGLEGRWYEADAVLTGLREQGLRAVLARRSRSDGTGLEMSLSPGWGTAAVGEEGLLTAFEDVGMMSVIAPVLRLDGRVSWGERIGGLHALRPYTEFSFDASSSRHLRGGLALEGPVRASLAAERRESAIGPVDHGLMLWLDTSF